MSGLGTEAYHSRVTQVACTHHITAYIMQRPCLYIARMSSCEAKTEGCATLRTVWAFQQWLAHCAKNVAAEVCWGPAGQDKLEL